ncbi:hypothetical protein GCM10009830_15010 [Glycomyces endophyticus]|uniref:DUF1023 domain-containing protein n=1 Tax=Glycomyces endophyticus TaxID=480996 RepID=A0ABN2GEY4_9ACTN
MALVYVAGLIRGEAEAEPLHAVPVLAAEPDAELAALRAAAPVDGDDPADALDAALAEPEAADLLAAAVPDAGTGELGAALADLHDAGALLDPVEVGGFFAGLGEERTAWLAVLYPTVIARMPGAPFDARIAANRIVLEAAATASTAHDGPERPWTEERPVRADLAQLVGSDREFVYLDPYGNGGTGSWIEVVGDLGTASEVAVLVPGGSAMIDSENFNLYRQRAESFVAAGGGELAVLVWAEAPSPSGWIEEAWASWSQVAARSLAAFTFDLRAQLGGGVGVTLVGHSYGGAVVGTAETLDLAVDRVLHIASAGMGSGVYGPEDYTEPCRDRYSITAPGDPISYVQGMPYVPLLGHGADPDEFPGVRSLATGSLSDAPDAVDDYGVSLAERGLSGKTVEGVHSHSEIFYPESDAWNNILKVMLGGAPALADAQPEANPDCP